MNYFIVDSVKGGCGKSTIALWKAVKLKLEDLNRKVCYVDLDILGTSMETFIGCRKDSNVVYLNALFAGERNAVKKKRVTNSFKFNVKTNGENQSFALDFGSTDVDKSAVEISAIFCSPIQKDKNLFRPNYLTGGQCIDYTFFALRLKELFEELNDGGYTDIVIDMPPNSDPYTDSVFDLLLHRTSSSSPLKKWNVTLLLISTFDRAHMEANVNWYQGVMKKDHNWHPFDKVECYFNDVRDCISKSNITLDTEMKPIPSNMPGKQLETIEERSNCRSIIHNHVNEILKCVTNTENKEVQIFAVAYNEMLSLYAISSNTSSVSNNKPIDEKQRLPLDLIVNELEIHQLKK